MASGSLHVSPTGYDNVYMYVHFSELLDWVFIMIILISVSYVHEDHVTPIWHYFYQLKNNSL